MLSEHRQVVMAGNSPRGASTFGKASPAFPAGASPTVGFWAVYGRLSVGKGLFEHSAVAGWCGHVSDL